MGSDREPLICPSDQEQRGHETHRLDFINAKSTAWAHAGSTFRSTMTGSVKVNVEPWPGCDSTQTVIDGEAIVCNENGGGRCKR